MVSNTVDSRGRRKEAKDAGRGPVSSFNIYNNSWRALARI